MQTDHEFVTLAENSVFSSSRFRASTERLVAVFSHKRKSSQESHSDRDGIPLVRQSVQGENEGRSRLSESENDTRFIIEEQRQDLLSDHILSTEARMQSRFSRLFHSCTSKTVFPVVWRLTIANIGYETSRTESRQEFTKNWRIEKKDFEKLKFEAFTMWKN